ncbi:MAG TPA: DUF262 domain-containing protein [Thermoanaerobaculia bacterium]|jgi:hypothetical protein|nr:DUF262 domain-containing protein [Thermoanaerobaculia bacterium]
MEKAVRSVYNPLDFQQWKASSTLSLTPKFQRRGVWKPAARSFFIDTLLRGMPVPPLYIRQIQSPEHNRVIREVVDGQQRISAVLDYLEGSYRLSRTLKAGWAGKTFQQLTQAERDSIGTYSFSTEVFHGISDLEVLEIFSRLNIYSVKLNAQELRNGRFFGAFKQSAYALAYEHLEFWRRHKIFTEQAMARMLEVEFVSEILIAFLAGMQDKKKSIDTFYVTYDEAFEEQEQIEKRFREVVDTISDTFGDSLVETAFRRIPLLYTLFCAIYHHRHGLPGTTMPTPKKTLSRDDRIGLREAVETLSENVEAARAGEDVPRKYLSFATFSLRQTDNIRPRTERLEALYKTAFS